MKLKTILGLIACAGACASFSAFANTTNTWFSATPSGSTLTLTTTVNTNGAAVTVANDFIELDLEKDDALVFTPTANSDATSDGLVTLSVSAILTPCDTNEFETIDGAKTGFAVGVNGATTNFYGYVAGGWLALDGTVPGTVETTAIDFKLELNYRDGKVKFVYDGGYLTENGTNEFNLAATASSLAHVDVWGCGKIGTVASSFEAAVAAYADKKYGSIAEATAAAKAASVADPTAVVQAVDSNGTVAEVGAVAANGLSKIVCKALGLDMTEPTANIAVAPVGTDEDEDEITLAVNVTGANEASAVQYKVEGGSETKYYDAGSVKIPITAGTYTITPVLK